MPIAPLPSTRSMRYRPICFSSLATASSFPLPVPGPRSPVPGWAGAAPPAPRPARRRRAPRAPPAPWPPAPAAAPRRRAPAAAARRPRACRAPRAAPARACVSRTRSAPRHHPHPTTSGEQRHDHEQRAARRQLHLPNSSLPAKRAASPSSSSMRSSRLYLAIRSPRDAEPGLDQAAAAGDHEVGDRRVLGLAGAVRDHRPPAVVQRQPQRVLGLGQGADLVELDQHRVGDPLARCRGR